MYRATGYLIPVIIEEIHLEDGFKARLAAVDGIVLCCSKEQPKGPTVFTVGAAWGYLGVEPDSWSVAMNCCVWRVMLKEEACDAVLRVCKEKPGLDPDVVFQLADPVSRHPSVKEIPDTVAELKAQILESFHRNKASQCEPDPVRT